MARAGVPRAPSSCSGVFHVGSAANGTLGRSHTKGWQACYEYAREWNTMLSQTAPVQSTSEDRAGFQ